MRKIASLISVAVFGFLTPVFAQTPAPATAQPKSSSAQKPGTSAKTSAAAKSKTVQPPYGRELLRPALLKDQAPDTYEIKFTTTRGDFTITVTRAWAPLGADRFYNLVKHHFYDSGSVFRVVSGFVAQFGLSAYPPVSAAWAKATITDDPVVQSNKKGFLTFATAGPNTRTTQVFINLNDNKRLDGLGFAPFGQVTDGMNVVAMFYDQYGDNAGPDQGEIEKQGKPYLDKGWPKLDSILTAVITSPIPTEPAKPASQKKAPKAAAPTTKPQ
jgi:peptidyl-prolyl cis-trans isomerase A (cyclophilin A)